MRVSFLFKFGGFIIPNEYIVENGYECAPSQRQDLNPWTDANGLTHRNVVPHTKSEVNITFRTLKWSECEFLIEGLVSNYTNEGDRDANCQYLNFETMSLQAGHFYLDPSCKFKVKKLNDKVDSFTLKFIEY